MSLILLHHLQLFHENYQIGDEQKMLSISVIRQIKAINSQELFLQGVLGVRQ